MVFPSRDNVDLVSVIGSRVQLTNRGNEFVALCPFHDDKNPSFFVVPDKGFAHCFGCGWNGDAIDFIKDHDGIDFKAALDAISQPLQALPIKAGLGVRSKPKMPWTSSKPPPDNPMPSTFTTRSLGDPVATWCYRDTDGAPLGYDARYEVKNKDGEQKKLVMTWTYGHDTELRENVALQWAPRTFNRPRPLYGLDRIAANTDKQIIIVSGCKTADAAQQLFPQSISVTWCGGDQNAKYANWTPLSKRECIIVPDADESGHEAGRYIAACLHDLGCNVRLILPENEREKGWDLADALAANWTPSIALDWARKLVKPYQPTAKIMAIKLAELSHEENVDIPPSFSDDALTATFTRRHAKYLRYVSDWGNWLVWDNKVWKRDAVLQVHNLARLICRETVNWERGALLSEAGKRTIASAKTAASVERIARSAPEHASTADQWDCDPWLLNTPTGIINLKNGELRPSRWEDYATRLTEVSAEGDCPRWKQFIGEITNGDIELSGYLQRFSGYALTGVTSEHALAFFYGTGANGKSIFLDTVRGIVGNYGTAATMEAFQESKTERHSTEIATLMGRRLVTAQETSEAKRWDESKIKELTSSKALTARFMRQDFFSFEPQFKLMFAGNHKPSLRSVDESIRRRVHIVPFLVKIPEGKRDLNLFDTLKLEWPGILQWMVSGCLQWQQHGLKPPDAIRLATDEYMQSEDAIGSWINDCCEIKPEFPCAVSDLYNSWKVWSEKNGEHAGSGKMLSQKLLSKGFGQKRTARARLIVGLKLRLIEVTYQGRAYD